ncbi:MAG: hypothetical protein WDN23_02340 [Edaphobacter sp.]
MRAELTKGIDVKKAKVGDVINAKTTASVTLADGTELPKGTKLMGKVTEARPKSNSDKTSHVAFSLEQAVTKDGHEIPLQVMVTSLAVPQDSPEVAAVAAGAHGGGATPAKGGGPTTASDPNQTYVQQSVIKSQTQQSQGTDGTVGHAPNQHMAVGNLPGAILTSADGTDKSASVDLPNENVWLGQGTQMTLFVATKK